MKRYIVLTLTVLLVILSACDNSKDTEEVKKEEQVEEEFKKVEDKKVEERVVTHDGHLKIGESKIVKTGLGNYEATLISGVKVEETDNIEITNDVLVKVDVSIKNVSESPIEVFNIIDVNSGLATSSDDTLFYFPSSVKAQDGVKTIQSGETVSIEIHYDVPEDKTYLFKLGDEIVAPRTVWSFELRQ